MAVWKLETIFLRLPLPYSVECYAFYQRQNLTDPIVDISNTRRRGAVQVGDKIRPISAAYTAYIDERAFLKAADSKSINERSAMSRQKWLIVGSRCSKLGSISRRITNAARLSRDVHRSFFPDILMYGRELNGFILRLRLYDLRGLFLEATSSILVAEMNSLKNMCVKMAFLLKHRHSTPSRKVLHIVSYVCRMSVVAVKS